jgi:D-alanyl-D-alanine carboxypeptidase
MRDKSPDSQLEDFRYDAKLFRQAYKAGIKLKEVEKEQKRKRKFQLLFGFVFTILFTILTLFLIKNFTNKSPSYIKANSRSTILKDFNNNLEVSPNSSSQNFDEDFVEAESVLYADLNTGYVHYAKNIEEPVYIASITKLVSALVALENFDLSEEVEVKKDWFAEKNMSWSLGLDKGDTITVESLLKGMLISSYNDAAFALADHMEGGWEVFVEEMNNYSETLGLKDTQFYNPSGLDEYGANISTAKDVYRISTVIYRNKFIMETLSRGYSKLEWDIGSEDIYTTNVILNKYGNIAGKTGNTEKAGGCFLSITEEGFLTLVLNSDNRFDDTVLLLTEL